MNEIPVDRCPLWNVMPIVAQVNSSLAKHGGDHRVNPLRAFDPQQAHARCASHPHKQARHAKFMVVSGVVHGNGAKHLAR